LNPRKLFPKVSVISRRNGMTLVGLRIKFIDWEVREVRNLSITIEKGKIFDFYGLLERKFSAAVWTYRNEAHMER